MSHAEPTQPQVKDLLQRITMQESKLVQSQAAIEAKDAQLATLRAQIKDLEERNTKLQRTVEKLQIMRPKIAPELLLTSFKTALDKLHESLRPREGMVEYSVSRFDVQLKTNVTLDERGNITLQLPRLDEVLPSENLSVINLSLKTVPKPYVPAVDLVEVPNIVGMSKDSASDALSDRDLKLGRVVERPSISPVGTVISQEPPAYSRAPKNTAVNIVIAKMERAKVPDLLGKALEEGKKILVSSGLGLGRLTEKASREPKGTVLNQNPKAGSYADSGSVVDLVVSKGE